MNGLYGAMAPFYDEINAEIDYEAWAEFLDTRMKEAPLAVREVLDLCCGTGSMTFPLARRGYDMIGVDVSADMLAVARERGVTEAPDADILWLCQDARAFELYGTVQAAVCCLDSLNHLTNREDLVKVFRLLHNYLEPDGVLIFDVNARRKFEEDYGEEVYAFDLSSGFAVWQNFYEKERRICDFCITLFTKEEDGRYRRTDEWQRERYYPVTTLKKLLAECGFTEPMLYDEQFSPVKTAKEADACRRLHFVCHAIKERKS